MQADLESTIKEKYNLEAQIEQFKDDISGLKEAHADEVQSSSVTKSLLYNRIIKIFHTNWLENSTLLGRKHSSVARRARLRQSFERQTSRSANLKLRRKI